MKKVILLAACTAAVLLSGCSDNELASVGDGIGTSTQSAIGFHVVGNQAETRATPITPSNITTTDFNVVAFKNNGGNDGELFMGDKAHGNGLSGIIINHKNGKWDYADASDLHYWPKEGSLNFYAVSPASIAKGVTLYSWDITNTSKTITYSCFDEYGTSTGHSNPDVMYAIAKNYTQATKAGKVDLTFQHILSQIAFQAKTVNSDMQVDIKEIKIKNFKLGGTFTIPTDRKLPQQSDWDLGTAIYKLTAFTVVNKADDSPISVKGSNTAATDISRKTPMLFAPQVLTKWDVSHKKTDADANGESYLIINCKIKQKNDYLHGTADKYKELYVPFEASWEPGKRYIYTLIFGGGYDADGNPILQPINFEAAVDDWKEEPKSNVNL
mgnify:CR=1 FL=1